MLDEQTLTTSADWPLYRGTKFLKATPSTKAEYCRLRGWAVPSDESPDERGYTVEYQDGGKPNLDGFDGYVSWSPAGVFERSYHPVGSFLDRLKIEHDELDERIDLGRRARARRATLPIPKLAAGSAGMVEDAAAETLAEAPAPPAEVSPEQMVGILGQQVGVCRQAFFRLASVRAADLVKFEGKSWDDGANYINAEMQGLDQQLASVVPPPQGHG